MYYRTYQVAGSLEETFALMHSANGGAVRLIAGGTDLMLQLHERLLSADTLIDISQIPELRGIRQEGQQIIVGASCTYTEIIASPLIRRYAFLLAEASREIGATQIQNMGTLGGNLGNASPAADAIPCLYALDAEVVLCSGLGERTVPIAAFHQGYRKIDLRPGELITAVRFSIPSRGTGTAFVKYGLRKSQAISVVNAAVAIRVEAGTITHAAVALGAVAPTVVRSPQAEKVLLGQEPGTELFQQAGEAARSDAHPIDDVRGSAAFRRHLVGVCVERALAEAWQRTSKHQEEA